MEENFARYAEEFFTSTIRCFFPTGIDAVGVLISEDEVHWRRECSFLVQVDGAKRVRELFTRMAGHLGHPRELVSEPECGTTWLQCRHESVSLLTRPSSRRPGGRWICSVFSTRDYKLPELDHKSIEDVLEMRYQSSSSESYSWEPGEADEFSEARVLEVRDLSIEVAQVLVDHEKLSDVMVTGYGHETDYGQFLVAGLSRIGNLSMLTRFMNQVLKEVPRINTVGIFDFKGNCDLRSAGWEGNYAVLLGQSIYNSPEE